MDEIIKLMREAKALGVESFEKGELKVKFIVNLAQKPIGLSDESKPEIKAFKFEIPPQPSVDPKTVGQEIKADALQFKSPFDNLTPEEVLYYATPYYDQLQAAKLEKELQQKEAQDLKQNS